MIRVRGSMGPGRDLQGSVGLLQKEGPFVEEAVVTEDVFPSILGQYPIVVESDGFP